MAISSGTWRPTSPAGVNQAIADTSTTQKVVLGQRVHAVDEGSTNYGSGEFVYAKGVASTAVGDVVSIEADGTTVRLAARGQGALVGVAMSANVANQYGWYQIFGLGVATSGTVAAHKTAYLTATAGSIDDAVVAGDIIYGMQTLSADDTGLCKVSLNYPRTADTDNA